MSNRATSYLKDKLFEIIGLTVMVATLIWTGGKYDARFDQIEARSAKLDASVAALEMAAQSTNLLRDEVKILAIKVDGLREGTSASAVMRRDVDRHDDALKDLDKRVDQHQSALAEIGAGQKILESKIDTVTDLLRRQTSPLSPRADAGNTGDK